MADAPASGAGARKGVGVQVPPRARIEPAPTSDLLGGAGSLFVVVLSFRIRLIAGK